MPSKDHHGVHIENEEDWLRLQYLIDAKSLEKVLISIKKYNKKYPSSKPYVSTLLKWHKTVVPREIYRPKPYPKRYYFYILTLLDHSVCKLGYTSNIVQRCYSIHREGLSPSVFDLNESYLKRLINKKTVRTIEQQFKAKLNCSRSYCPYRGDRPTGFYSSIGPTEWFCYTEKSEALKLLGEIDSGFDVFKVKAWLTNEKRKAADGYRSKLDH